MGGRSHDLMVGEAPPDGPASRVATLQQLVDELAGDLEAESRRTEAAEDQLKLRGLRAAEAHHTLKTHLSVVYGWARSLDDGWERLDERDRRACASAIRQAAEDMAAQIDGLLAEARRQFGPRHLMPGLVDLSDALQAAAAEFGAVSERHAVRFVGQSLPVQAWCDARALQDVLRHLIENAVKYSPDGGSIVLRARSGGGWAEIAVRDEGIGINGDADLFAPFEQGAPGAVGGVGLGLHVVKRLVETMGGVVAARKNRGRGSTFVVRLPAHAHGGGSEEAR